MDPESGVLFTANNRVAGWEYAFAIGENGILATEPHAFETCWTKSQRTMSVVAGHCVGYSRRDDGCVAGVAEAFNRSMVGMLDAQPQQRVEQDRRGRFAFLCDGASVP